MSTTSEYLYDETNIVNSDVENPNSVKNLSMNLT